MAVPGSFYNHKEGPKLRSVWAFCLEAEQGEAFLSPDAAAAPALAAAPATM